MVQTTTALAPVPIRPSTSSGDLQDDGLQPSSRPPSRPTTPSVEDQEDDNRSVYQLYESTISNPRETVRILKSLDFEIVSLRNGTLGSPARVKYFLDTALPRIIRVVLKSKYHYEDVFACTKGFLCLLLELLIEYIPQNRSALIQTLSAIFDHDSPFYSSLWHEHCMNEREKEIDETDWARSQSNESRVLLSHNVCDLINHFGRHKGFEVIANHANSPNCELETLGILLEAISKTITNGYLVEAKTMQFALELKQAAYDKLMPLKDFKLKYIKKEHIESIVRPLTKILDNVFTREECGRFIEMLCLEVALNSLRSSFFDKKLYGLNYISEMVDMVRRGEDSSLESTVMVTGGEGVYRGLGPTARWVTRAYLIQWIQSNNVLETVFGNAAHPQLIRRAGDLIRLLARQNELTEQHLNLILSRAKDCHETQAASVLTVLTESAGQLSLQHQQHIHEFISQTPVQSYTVPTLRFIYDLSRFAQDVELKLRFADLLWSTVLLQGHLEASLESMRLLEEIIRHQSYMHNHRASWVDRILSAINQGQSVPFCYRLLEAVQVALPRDIESLRAESLSSQPGEEAIILDTFFNELERFKPRLQAIVQKAIEELPPPIDYNNLSILDFTLVDQLRYRLHFLQFLLTHAPQVSNFGQQHLDKLFDCFILQPTTPVEANECFLWLLTSPPIVIDLVSSAFPSLVRKINFEKLTTNGLKFIQRFFCETNSRQQKMQMRYSNNELDFELQTTELDSYDLLWDVLVSVPTELVRDSVDFVTKFQYKLAPHLNDTSIQLKLREEFVERCISYIEPALQSNILSEIEERKVERSLSLLLMQCEGERGKSDSHGARTRGKPLILYVENLMNDSVGDSNGDKSKKYFKLELHGNETVGGVRKKVAETLGLSGDKIQDLQIFLEYEVLENDEKRLNELDFQSSQTIVVRSAVRIPAEKKTQLRGRNSAPTASPSPAKVEIPPDAKEKAQQLMEIYSLGYSVAMFALKRAGWDLPNAASSLFDDRTQLMQLAAESNEFREGQDDKEEERPDEGEEGDPRTRVSTILCNREAYLNQLFYLLNSKSEAICRKAWSLLMLLPTNKSLLQELRTLSDLRTGTADWTRLFDKDSYFKLLYSLQVVDSIIFPLEDSYDSEGKRAVWCKAFLVLGGLEMLSDILLSYPAQDYANLPSEQKSGIAIVTKLFHFFLHSLLIEERIPSLILSGNAPLECSSSPLEEPPSLNLRGSNGGIAALEDIVPSSPSLNRVSRMVHKISQEVSTRQLDEIKYDSLLCKLLEVVSAATSTPDRDDDTLAYAMRIIVLCILYQTDSLLPKFYNFPGLDEVLVSGLLRCPISFIRSEVAEGVYRLCNKVINRAAEYEMPHPYFLRLLLNNFPDHLSPDPSVWTRTAQYFNLLNKLISDSYNPLYSPLPRSPTELLHFLIKCIKESPTVESVVNGVDETLVGLLTVTATLLKKEPPLRSSTEFNFLDLVDEVYSRCLFVQNTGSRVQPKCAMTRSRAAAFSLLVELSRDSTQNVARLLDLLLQNHTGGLKSNSWDYHPVSDSKANGYVGLVNLGATCYMNSLLQQLYMMPAMRAGVLSLGRLEKDTDSLLYQLQLIFAHLQESERSSYKPEGFCVAHKDWGGNPTNVHLQQDVDEFFHQLCQRLESITKGSQQEKLLHTLFGGTLSNEIRSQTKDFPYYAEREEEFFTISLDIKNKRNIQEALDLYVKGDKLEGDNAYYCDKYERKLDVEKRVCLKRLSNTLILHLKRFDFDFNIQKKMKINDYCEFPLRLNMYPWTKEGLMQKGGVAANEASGETKPTHQPSSYYEYELVGVLVHSGDAEGGHYYSYIKERATKQRMQAPCWSEFNDNCVFPFDSKSLASECFGGEETTRTWDSWTRKYIPKQIPKQRSAYMLFYERIQPEVAVTVALPEEASPSISVSNFDLEKSSHTSHGIPEDVYQRIWVENSLVQKERHLFDKSYFEFMLNWSNVCVVEPLFDYGGCSTPGTEDHGLKAIKLLTVFGVEVLMHAKSTEAILISFMEQLKAKLSLHIPACKWFLQYLIDTDAIKEYFFECPNELARVAFSELVVQVLRVLCPFEYDFFEVEDEVIEFTKDEAYEREEKRKAPRALSVRFMDVAWSLLEDSRKHWTRFKQYFVILKEFAAMGHQQRKFYLNRKFFEVMNDWFMGQPKRGRSRVSVMDNFNFPDLVEFVSLLSIVVRGCENGSSVAEKGYPPTTIRDGEVHRISESEVKELYDQTFFVAMMKMDYNREAVIEIVLHSCWEDLQRSKKIIDYILSGLNNYSEKMLMLKAILTFVLQMTDSLQESRLKIAFGSSNNGLFILMRDRQSTRISYATIKFIVNLSETVPVVKGFLLKQSSELLWMEKTLESKIGSAVIMDPFEREQLQKLLVERDREDGRRRKQAMAYGLYLQVKALRDQGEALASDSIPTTQLEKKLFVENEVLRAKNKMLWTVVQRYRDQFPGFVPAELLDLDEFRSATNGGVG